VRNKKAPKQGTHAYLLLPDRRPTGSPHPAMDFSVMVPVEDRASLQLSEKESAMTA
jgi:hypothetical protein